MNLQPILSGGKGVATDLQIAVSEGSGSIVVFLGVAVLERIGGSREALQYKMLVGRLANAGWSLRELQRALGHDPRTIKKWAAALVSEDIEFIVEAFGGRGRHAKLSPAVARYAKRRYWELRAVVRNYREVVASEVLDLFGVRLSREPLRRLFREADREERERNDQGAVGPLDGPAEAATGCGCEPFPSLHGDRNDNQSPAPPCTPLAPIPRAPARAVGVHHAGMMLFAVLLELFCRNRRWAAGLQTQWLGQVLQGAVNIERSRLISAEDLARFTGPVLAATDPQREALRQMAGLEATMDVYAANARLLHDGPGRGRIFYYDPHSKEYTGALQLLKDWCGRTHGITKTLHLDMIHTRSGRACFLQHYSPYYDLRERFFMTLELFNRLFPAHQRRGRIFALDRGIFGLSTFARFAELGDHVLTWEKGYKGDGWEQQRPQVVFTRYRPRNHAGDLQTYRFECREQPWRRDPTMRRILVRATNPKGRTVLVAILCSATDLAIEEAVWIMFSRWLQENDFRYLDRHFGLNQLTSYASVSVQQRAAELQDKPVDSPEYKELKQQTQMCENELARLLLRRERNTEKQLDNEQHIIELQRRLLDDSPAVQRLDSAFNAAERSQPPEPVLRRARRLLTTHRDLDRQLRSAQKARRTLQRNEQRLEGRIAPVKEHLHELEQRLCAAVREQSRLRLLIDNNYRMLNTRCKAMLDALRITASNMFAELLRTFRPIYNNYRNDHAMLRNLTRADGFLCCQNGCITLRLWLKGRFQARQLTAFRTFLAEMTDSINEHFALCAPPVRIALLEQPPTW